MCACGEAVPDKDDQQLLQDMMQNGISRVNGRSSMADLKQHKLGWIGIGRMRYAMAERLARAGCDLAVWNRARAKVEQRAASGAHVVDVLTDLAACDIVFTMVSTGTDVKEVLVGTHGV